LTSSSGVNSEGGSLELSFELFQPMAENHRADFRQLAS
jgi:hypothetical protein